MFGKIYRLYNKISGAVEKMVEKVENLLDIAPSELI